MKKTFYQYLIVVIFFIAPMMMGATSDLGGAGCLGQVNGDNGDNNNDQEYNIGGTLSGLNDGESIVLFNNDNDADDALELSENGGFVFTNKLMADESYSITVFQAPEGQTCTVLNGEGLVSGDVSNISVTCTSEETYTVTVVVQTMETIAAEGTPLTLSLEEGGSLSFSEAGMQSFPNTLPNGTYALDIVSSPTNPSQTCNVTSGGSDIVINGADVTVEMICSINSYSLGITVTGFNGPGMLDISSSVGGSLDPITMSGIYTFPDSLVDQTDYTITFMGALPPEQLCHFNPPGDVSCNQAESICDGTIDGSNVNLDFVCEDVYTLSGSVTGLDPLEEYQLTFTKSGSSPSVDDLTSAYVYSDLVTNTSFTIEITGSPFGKACTFDNPAPSGISCDVNFTSCSGTINGASITDLNLTCL